MPPAPRHSHGPQHPQNPQNPRRSGRSCRYRRPGTRGTPAATGSHNAPGTPADRTVVPQPPAPGDYSGTMSGAPSLAASAVRSSGWRCDSRSASTRFS